MSKLSKLLVSLFLAQLFLANAAIAATAPQYLAPANSFLLMELNTNEENPLDGKLQPLFDEHSANSDNPEAWKILSPYLENTTLGYSQSFHQTDGSDIHFMSLAIPEDVFKSFLAALTDVETTNLSMNRFVYLTDEDFYFSYLNGNLIAASKEGIISDLLMESNPSTISNNTDYQYFLSKVSPDSFFKVFINFENMPEGEMSDMNWLRSEAIAIQQTLNGLEGSIIVAPSADSNTNLSSFNFVPELYKQVNPKNLMLYGETFNLRGHGAETMKLMSTEDMDFQEVFAQISTSFQEETGLSWDGDLATLFEQRTAWAIHSDFDQQYYPAITLISEVRNREGVAKTILAAAKDKLISDLNESFEEAYQAELSYRENYATFYTDPADPQLDPLPPKEELRKRFYQVSTVTMPDGSFDQITIDPNARQNFDADSTPVDANKAFFHISARVTSGGQLIVTTFADPKEVFSTPGLASDADWVKNFNSESMLEVSYLHFGNLKKYLLDLGAKFETGEEFTQGVEDFLGPFSTWYSKTKIDQGYISAQFKLGMDLSKIDGLIKMVQQLGIGITESFDRMEDDYYEYTEDFPGFGLANNFSDVNSDAWFAKDVFNLDYYDIMNGYGDQFRPNQNITRAEFVKTLMTANENYRGIYYTAMEPQEYFTDVASGSWYAPYINKARAHKIVEGYPDNTFHPNSPITRAEAVKIIAESAPELFGMNSPLEMHKLLGENHPFYDVLPTDWFYNSVYGAYWAKVVTGKSATSFAPHEYLTRAETAALINRFMNL